MLQTHKGALKTGKTQSHLKLTSLHNRQQISNFIKKDLVRKKALLQEGR